MRCAPYVAGLALVASLGAGCNAFPGGRGDDGLPTPDSGNGSGTEPVDVFDPAIARVVVEIDYETDQEPFTDLIDGFGDTFDPTLANLDRAFAGKKQLTIPTSLENMQDVGMIADEELTLSDILTIAAHDRNVHDLPDLKSYYVIFVSGHFANQNGVQPGVLGVSYGDTIAIFKDVIRTTDMILDPNVVRYVEQSTLIHELAHAVGLVDNGVSMLSPHKDAQHGAHCSNPDCVMYWQDDGAADARDFTIRRLLTGSSILFDDACLADLDARSGGL